MDGGYEGPTFAQQIKELRPKREVGMVKHSDDVEGLNVLRHRCAVERTFAGLMRHHRLVRDYQTTESSPEAWIYIAMIRIQIRQLGLIPHELRFFRQF